MNVVNRITEGLHRLQICFRGVAESERLLGLIRANAAGLSYRCGQYLHCRILVERCDIYFNLTTPCRVRIDITQRVGLGLVVEHSSGNGISTEELEQAICNTFSAAEQRLMVLAQNRPTA